MCVCVNVQILYFTFKVHIAWTERRYKRYLRKVSNDDDEQTENDDDDDDDDGQTENDNTNENTFTKIKRNLTYNNFADAITILFKSLESLFNVIFILDVLVTSTNNRSRWLLALLLFIFFFCVCAVLLWCYLRVLHCPHTQDSPWLQRVHIWEHLQREHVTGNVDLRFFFW